MDIGFLITTYNRQESCQKLVDSLQGLGGIVVLNDGCDYVISGCEQHFLQHHNGKAYYWHTVKTLFKHRGKHDYYIMLPDDFLPMDNMIEEIFKIWDSIKDPDKICLNLLADRIGQSCWTTFKPVEKSNYWHTQWVDMCFFCESKFFDVLGSIEVNYLMSSRINAGSGVGAVISRQLNRKRYKLYQVKESLVIPQGVHYTDSQMHDYSHIVRPRKNKHSRKTKIIFDTRKTRKK